MSLIFTKKTIYTVSLEYESTISSQPFNQAIREAEAPFVAAGKTDGQVEILIGMNEAKYMRGWVDLESAESWVSNVTAITDRFMVTDTYEIVDYTTTVTVA